MQILHALGKALLFFGVQATVLIGVVLAVRWQARRKATAEHEEEGLQPGKRP